LSGSAVSQITATNAPPYNSQQYLVENVLLGAGVTASNFVYTGSPDQIGFFNGTNSNLGLDSGIVMSSGHIDGVTPTGFGTPAAAVSGDPDMLVTANSVPPMIGQTFSVSSVNDVSILEFDFIPSADTVKFRYVFGSDEYQTYINTTFNDVFGFYISGPGITPTDNVNNGTNAPPADGVPDYQQVNIGGTAYFPENIAVVPNSTPPLPITISSVQPNLNGQFYIDNPANTTVGLNGFTTILTAISPVVCGQTYHIKIAIADGTDTALDSGVFLEASSFSSGTVIISATPSYSTTSGDTTLYEGCGAVTLTFVRAGNIANPDTIFYNISGTAINDTDYSFIPDSVYFAAGQDSVTISFTPLDDGIIEGMETIQIDIIGDSTGCLISGSAGIILTIYDPVPLVLSVVNDTMDCTSDSINILVNITSGIPQFTYQWSTGDTDSSIYVSPATTTDYYVSVTDGCNTQTVDTVIKVVVQSDDLTLTPQDTSAICPGDTVQISVSISDGYPPYTNWWSNGVQNDTSQTLIVISDTSYIFYVIDQCGIDTDSVTVNVFMPNYALLTVDAGQNDTLLCPGDPIAFEAAAQGGSGGYQFTWDGWQTLSDSVVANPDSTIILTVGVTDNCKFDTVYNSVEIYVPQYNPLAVTSVPDTVPVCPGEQVDMKALATGGTGVYTYSWNNFAGNKDSVSVFPLTSVNYTVIVEDECENKDSAFVTIIIEVPEAAFTYDYRRDNVINFTNESSDDAITFDWDFGDGNDSEDENPTHSYKLEGVFVVTLIVANEFGCTDTAREELKPPTVLWVPNVFTPNGDGKNDEFEIRGIGITKFEITIFDRWGARVFWSEDINRSWDGKTRSGKTMKTGVYVYLINAIGFDRRRIEKPGTVTLLGKK